MKKTVKYIFLAIFILSVTFALGGCDFDISSIFGEYVCVHEWSEWDIVEQGNCKTPGIIQRECTKCGAIDEETTALKDHTEGEWIVDKVATCVEEGSMHKECIVCGKTLSTEKISTAGEHIESNWIVDKDATCTEDGEKHTKCTVCGITTNEEKIPASEEHHKYENYNCVYCGVTNTDCFVFTYLQESDSYEIKAKSKDTLPSEISLPNYFNGKPVSSIGIDAFSNCKSLTSITIRDSVACIGDWAFNGCSSLTNVVMGSNVSTLGARTFYFCTSLTSIVIPDSVASIGDYAFWGCDRLYVVYNSSDLLLKIGSESNGGVAKHAKILVNNKETTYANDEFIYTLTDDGFLFKCKDSKYELIAYIGGEDTVILPTNINGNDYELYCMSGVRNVIIPEGFTEINASAFFGCESLNNIVIPNSAIDIGYEAFYYCENLDTIVIGNNVSTIGDYAFFNCKSLTNVIISNSVTFIGDYAFYYCYELVNIYYTGTASEWNSITVFYSNESLKNATIYFYSETKPTTPGNFWHWVDGEVVVWE